MNYTEEFWNAGVEEIMDGYKKVGEGYLCLLCGEYSEEGVIYKKDDTLCDAQLYMKKHVAELHGSSFEYLIDMDRKFTGLSPRHIEILKLMYQGKTDKEIQKALDINSLSTVRNHRFAINEKRRQAKLSLALITMVQNREVDAPKIVEPHVTATTVDDRFNVTQDEYDDVVAKSMPGGRDTKLLKFPKKQKQKIIVLNEISKSFKRNVKYTEKQVNAILMVYWYDYVLIRRYLIEYGFMDRLKNGSEYWLL